MTKAEIIQKYWPKPHECNVPNIPAMKDAISKMMDEWVQEYLRIENGQIFNELNKLNYIVRESMSKEGGKNK